MCARKETGNAGRDDRYSLKPWVYRFRCPILVLRCRVPLNEAETAEIAEQSRTARGAHEHGAVSAYEDHEVGEQPGVSCVLNALGE
jgi:hypothetical protein